MKSDDCVDKTDLLNRFTEAQTKRRNMLADREREEQRRLQEKLEREKRQKMEGETKDRVIKEVHRWARGMPNNPNNPNKPDDSLGVFS